jgi:hypothetical protein
MVLGLEKLLTPLEFCVKIKSSISFFCKTVQVINKNPLILNINLFNKIKNYASLKTCRADCIGELYYLDIDQFIFL